MEVSKEKPDEWEKCVMNKYTERNIKVLIYGIFSTCIPIILMGYFWDKMDRPLATALLLAFCVAFIFNIIIIALYLNLDIND